MNVKLSVDPQSYKKEIENLRRKLNESLASGIISDNFEQELKQLEEMQQRMLTELLPYYRLAFPSALEVTVENNVAKRLGSYSPDIFNRGLFRLSSRLFLATSMGGKLQLLNLKSTGGRVTSEWSDFITGINETVTAVFSLGEGQFFLVGIRGGCYRLTVEDKAEMSALMPKITNLKVSGKSDGFGKCAAIGNGLFAAETGAQGICILKLSGDYVKITGVTQKVMDDYTTMGSAVGMLLAGNSQGYIAVLNEENGKITAQNPIKAINNPIMEICPLQNESGTKESLLVLGTGGEYAVAEVAGGKIISAERQTGLSGNLFAGATALGTGLILSDDGQVYLLEENLGNWSLNSGATQKEAFFTKAVPVERGKYLLTDLDGEVTLMKINRLDTPEALLKLPIYK